MTTFDKIVNELLKSNKTHEPLESIRERLNVSREQFEAARNWLSKEMSKF